MSQNWGVFIQRSKKLFARSQRNQGDDSIACNYNKVFVMKLPYLVPAQEKCMELLDDPICLYERILYSDKK